MAKVGVISFLGTNCDRDVHQAVATTGHEVHPLFFKDRFEVNELDAVVLPGGFSHGDYLRCGAFAARTPVMKSVHEANKKGLPILGICNGFQILCEAQLLPGVLMGNQNLRFIDKWVSLKRQNTCASWGGEMVKEQVCIPIAHGEGRFFIPEDQLKEIWDREQVWWTYEDNPNGSVDNIAGLMNKEKNVAALMPHPERALFDWMNGVDGRAFFETL